MALNQCISITQSVGKGGVNATRDVKNVQTLLNAQMPPHLHKLMVDGIVGPATIAMIQSFQRHVLGFRRPDGRVDPKGRTLAALNDPTSSLRWAQGLREENNQWGGDSARWPQEKKLQSLNPDFREKVKKVLAALEKRGFQPKIFYAWRSVAVQQELVRKGRSKVRFSFHNAQLPDGTPNAYAADIVDKRWGWQDEAEAQGFWDALGEEAKKLGLVWGGDWQRFKDVAHIQGRQNSELAAVKRESGL